jgi:pheromone a factor receptor
MSYHAPDPRYSDPSVNRANAIALPIFAVIGSIFVIFPFRAFYLLRNFPACSMCITLWIINLGTFLNAIIWSTDDWTTWWPGYGLCDVESVLRWPITLSASTGLCCFLRGLANALNTDGAIMNPTKAQRRRQLIGEILIIWGPPALVACLRYIIQAGRYAIVPVFGCTGEDDNSWPYVVVVVIWGPVFTTIASGYSSKLLRSVSSPINF